MTQLEEENQYIEYYYGWIEILGKSKTIKKELAIANVAKLVSFCKCNENYMKKVLVFKTI